ncbi:MAG: selenocysteine-specific translation elongation factor [Candidatus Eremiobacteraeota bacterium]|nr:selenocysteine-specific translation elongation factor [Candidatus Eremiobacteraeota bacterium]
MHILGTAGHVDHGKSSLVRALTGTDPDRFIEERVRGMTLDLGFAHLRFADGVEAGVVDVPGHERFLHNMLAGAAGMELLLLVVAANEGPKPQTLDHLDILSYLNVKRTIVVLTKSDTVDAEELGYARELVAEALAGTFAQGADSIAVSTLTGDGLESLRAAIHAALIALPPRAPQAPAYFPIDRAFALAGHGTIVTGTLMQGRIASGDTLALTPLGREVRVRSLQIFGTKREEARGGSRVAVNLPGIPREDVARGAVLASPQFTAHDAADVRFRALPRATGLLRRRTPVRAYIGSAEILGTLVFAAVPEDTGEVAARLHLREPTILFPGAAFVVRRVSPKTLLGGGTVATVDASAANAAHDESAETAAILAVLQRTGLTGLNAARAGALANVREELARDILTQFAGDGRALLLNKPPAYVDGAAADALLHALSTVLGESQARCPWLTGLTLQALAKALTIDEPTLARVLAVAVEGGRFVQRHGYFATADFSPELSADQRTFFAGLFPLDARQPYVPRPWSDVMAAVRASKIVGTAQALEMLLACRALIKVQDDIYRAAQVDEVRSKLVAAMQRDERLTMAAFRDLVGTSRKHAVPLLEWFDANGVTVRVGDVRVLRTAAREASPAMRP